jgi:hypothetical protein
LAKISGVKLPKSSRSAMPFDKKKLYFFPLLIKKAKAFFISKA